MTAVREERRLVTSMFIDVVGSTELTARLGAERLKRELGAAFDEIARVSAARGGTVEKYIGDAIYAVFGSPVAHEDDPLRALRAAEAVREVCRAGAEHGHPFGVRIGIETGEVIVDLEAAATTWQQMSFGLVVNIAARLQQRAEPGEILVGPTAREATASAAELEDLGDAELKGVGSLRVSRLVRVGPTQIRALPFVGREAELALLGHAFERTRKGRSVLAVVSGPPGQGKTRLVQEFLRRSASESRVVATRCRPADEVGVFAPVREILGVTTLDALAEQVGRLCADDVECERVVAGLAESAGIATSRSLTALPAAEREDEIVQAWRRYVSMVGGSAFLVLAIDDIHWADASLVRLVDRITFGGPRLLVVATARPEFADAAGLRPSGDRFFIELEGLEPEEARRLAALAGRDDEEVVGRAEGNPLFLVELARAGRDGADLPITLQGALGARLDHLPAADRALLSLAAVAGERFTAADAAFLSGRAEADTARTLAHLTDLHFLDLTEARYRFHHGLVRDVAYGRLLSAERMRAHARFAHERVHPEDAETLAHHWWQALRPPDAQWVWQGDPELASMRREAYRAHLAAGIKHADHFAVDQAIDLLGRALELAGDDREAAAAHHALAKAELRILRQDEAWSHLRQAEQLYSRSGSVPIEVHLALAEAAFYWGAFKERPGEDEVASVMEEGVAAARAEGDARSLALILLARARYMLNAGRYEPTEIEPHADAAVAAAEASGDLVVRRRTLEVKIGMLGSLGRFDEIGPLMAEIEAAGTNADALERLQGAMRRATYHFVMADAEADEKAVAEAMALAEPMGAHNKTHAWQRATNMYAARGEWQRIIDIAQRTARFIREGDGSAFCVISAGILRDGATGHALRGEREDALGLLGLVAKTTAATPAIVSAVPRALLGFPSPEIEGELQKRGRVAWDWLQAAISAVVLRRPDDAEGALAKLGRAAETAVAYRALAEGLREAIVEERGGPPATNEALRRIGYVGWIEVLKRRVDAEY